MNKRGNAPLIWGGLLIVLGLLLLAENLGWLGELNVPFWSLIFGATGLVFLSTYVSNRTQWWALIPGLVLLGVAIALFLAEQDLVADHVVSAIILVAVGLPFLLIFFVDRQHWWALIPAFTMVGVALGVFFEGTGAISGTAVAGFIFGGISLGFLAIHLIDREQWWTLIPGGIMGLMAIIFLLATVAKFIWPVAIILFGLLLLYGALRGGRRQARPQDRPTTPLVLVEAPKTEQKHLPTLEEQIENAIAEESGTTQGPSVAISEPTESTLPNQMPTAPDVPEPPEVPSPPDM